MTTYKASPGSFKLDAEAEATLERLEEYLDTMEMVFRLSRKWNLVTGNKEDLDDKEKKDLLRVEGGKDMKYLFLYVGEVVEEDTYLQAVTKIKVALKQSPCDTYCTRQIWCCSPGCLNQGNNEMSEESEEEEDIDDEI